MEQFELNNISLKNFAYHLFEKIDFKKGNKPVFVCVGSDKFICDSLAPIVAELLTKKYNINAYVYGGLEYNINASNLTTAINYIETEHPHSQLILIDATLGENVGKVMITSGSFAGLGKILPIRKIGNFSILGVVNKKTKNFSLNTTKLKIVMEEAKFIAKGIAMAIDQKTLKFYNKVQNNLI